MKMLIKVKFLLLHKVLIIIVVRLIYRVIVIVVIKLFQIQHWIYSNKNKLIYKVNKVLIIVLIILNSSNKRVMR